MLRVQHRTLSGPEMLDSGLIVTGMIGAPSRYDVTVTVDRDGGPSSQPVEFVMAAEQAASARAASVVTAHTADQIISAATVEAADRSTAVAVALAVVSKAPRRPAARIIGRTGVFSEHQPARRARVERRLTHLGPRGML